MMRFGSWLIVLGSLGFVAGCGGSDEDYAHKIENPDSPEVVYANDVRTYLKDMQDILRTEGPNAIDFAGYFEGMEGYGEEPPVGEHKETYDKIHSGVKEVQDMVKSGKSASEINSKIEDLLALTKDLPGATTEAEAPNE